VIRDLADGQSLRVLERKYGIAHTTIVAFKQKHADEIAELQEAVADEMHGLWIADKRHRVAEYQQMYDDLEATVNTLLMHGTTLGPQDMAILKEKRSALRNVAEELGQLPNRNQVSVGGASVVFNYPGIDPSDLT
jgi:hypothetical protein